MKTRKDLQLELNVSAATVANWLKTGLIPDYPNGTFYYDESTYNALLSCLIKEHGKLQKRANRTQNKHRLASANPPIYASARQSIGTLCKLFQKSNVSVNAFMLAVCLARLQQQFLVQVNHRSVYSLNPVFSQWLENWLLHTETNPEPLLSELAGFEFPTTEGDFLGITYESLRTVAEKSAAGAYFTPLKLVENIVVPENATVLDPCAGTGSMVLGIISRHHAPGKITLRDVDELALRIAKVNFVLFFNSAYALVNTEMCDVLDPVSGNEKFDLIVSNPPYGAALSATEKKALVLNYPEVGTSESFGIALVNALKHLQKNGKLHFILPESFLYVDAHLKLRTFIFSKERKAEVTHFGNAFKGVASRIIRLTITNTPSEGVVPVHNQSLSWFAPLDILQHNQFRPPFISSEMELRLLRKMWYCNSFSLRKYCTFGLGIVTGNNRANLQHTHGKVGFEPVYTGKELFPFRFLEPKNFLHFQPGHFQQSAPETLYRQPKVCYRFISDTIVSAADYEGKLLLNSANFFVPGPELPVKALSALLNSALITFFYRRVFNARKVLRSHLERLPLPVTFLANTVILTHLYNKAEAGLDVHAELNAFVCNLYGFTAQETAYIADVVKAKKEKLPKVLAA